jgi:hypothetical protein
VEDTSGDLCAGPGSRRPDVTGMAGTHALADMDAGLTPHNEDSYSSKRRVPRGHEREAAA